MPAWQAVPSPLRLQIFLSGHPLGAPCSGLSAEFPPPAPLLPPQVPA